MIQGRDSRRAPSPRDDRILPVTRVLAAFVIVILFMAWVALYVDPTDTATRFAWTIKSHMTAMLMGAGYGSAIVFYLYVLFGRRWHRVSLGLLPTTELTWVLLITTVLHWETFHHTNPGHGAFLLWLWIYLLTPIVVPAVWLLNRRHDPGTLEDRDVRVPRAAAATFVVAGVLLIALALLLFVFPRSFISVWPWKLTPVTARAITAFIALPGIAWLAIAADRRWSAARAMIVTVALGLALMLGAVVRAWGEFDHRSPLTYVYVAGLAVTLLWVLGVGGWLERQARSAVA